MDANNTQFGVDRLDGILRRCGLDAQEIITAVIEAVDQFTGGQPPEDDRTLLVAKIS
jgi:serine phosphatase RsbU (regulator of sigma subunit)